MNKAPIFVYNTASGTTMILKAVIEDYQTCTFNRSRDSVGTFTLSLSGKDTKVSELIAGNLIYIKPDNEHISRVGIIVTGSESYSGNTDTVTVTGFEAKGLTYWRNIMPDSGSTHWALTAAGETCIKSTISKYMGPSATTAKKIPFITVETDLSRGDSYVLSERFTNLETAMEDVATATSLWWYLGLDFDNKKLKLYVTPGLDRTEAQTVNTRCVFASKFKTILDHTRTDDYTDFRNVVYVGGQGEDTDRTVVEVGTATGWDRREKFMDRRDLSLTASLTAAGESEIESLATVTGIDLTVNHTQLQCDVDYSLGDLCVVSVFGAAYTARVTEISETWSGSGYSCDITVGKPVRNVNSLVKYSYNSLFRSISI